MHLTTILLQDGNSGQPASLISPMFFFRLVTWFDKIKMFFAFRSLLFENLNNNIKSDCFFFGINLL
jgi:hypothetical protein